MFRRDRAEHEFRIAKRLAELGVRTARPVAFAISRGGEESTLLTQTVEGGRTVYDLVEGAGGRIEPVRRRRFSERLADLVATLHNAGVEHPDLHERNILVREARPGVDELYLLDLHEATLGRRVRPSAAVRDLRRLGRYFSIRTSRTERLRFFLRYARLRGFAPGDVPQLARAVERATLESRADFWRRRDSRPLSKASGVRRRTRRGTEAFSAVDANEAFWAACLERPEAVLCAAIRARIKQGRRTAVLETDVPELTGAGSVVVKQYRYSWAREAVARLARDDPGTRAWRGALALALRDVPAPRPLLLVRRKRWGVVAASDLVLERIPDAVAISRYLPSAVRGVDAAQRRRIVRGAVEAAASLVRRLHERGASHHDLKGTNVLAVGTEDPARPSLWLVDLDSVRTWRRVPERERVQNLGRLQAEFADSAWLTRTDRLRFLKAYLGAEAYRTGVWKSLWRTTARWAARKAARTRRNKPSR
jgi:tRNA A-37 threonylcarbamoyl transferase component Bud32